MGKRTLNTSNCQRAAPVQKSSREGGGRDPAAPVDEGVADGQGLGANVAHSGVGVAVGDGVNVGVGVAVGVALGTRVRVEDGVGVMVAEGVGEAGGNGVRVTVAVRVALGV
jgi:hypothetical protein